MPEQAHDDDLGWNIGRYTLYGEIAAGGMATVHIGRMVGEVGFAKLVAIKRLHSHLAKDPEFLDMFLDEVRLAGRIRHPNVVQPLDVVVLGSEVFLVMEYIHGESLARILRNVRQQNGSVPLRIASAIMSGALAGLHAAHEAKDEHGQPLHIVHRDVSPQNMLVGVDGIARVLDFGIAKAADQAHSTKVGELKGKIAYMAPEQIKGKPATRRTDVYAATIVLWECLTGVRLFDMDATPLGAILKAQANIAPPSKHNRDVPPALDELVLKGLAVNPDLRFESALAMADALDGVLPGATQSQVGQWVEAVAKASIVERNARIAGIERTGADPTSRPTAQAVLSGGYSRVDELSASALLAEDPSSSSIKRATGSGTGSQRLVPQAPPTPRISQAPPVPGRPSSPGGSTPAPGAMYTPAPGAMYTPAPPGSTPVPAPPGSTPPARKNLVVPSGRPVAPEPSQPIVVTASGSHPAPPPVVERPPPSSRQPSSPFASAPNYYVPEEPARATAPSLEPPAVPLEPAKPAKITIQKLPGRRRSIMPYLWIVVGIGLLVFAVMSPELLRRKAIEAAAADGLVMSVDAVDISLKAMRFEMKNVNVTNPSMPGCSVHADLAVVTLDGVAVSSVTLHNANIALDGGASALTDAWDKWTGAHADLHVLGGAPRVQIENGRLLWTGVLGPGTKVEGSGIVGDVGRQKGRPLGADATFTFPALTLDGPAGAIGPWRFEHTREASATKTKVQLDPGAPGGPGFTVTTAPGSPTVVDGTFSRAKIASLGLPPVLLGQKQDDPTKLDLALHLEITDQKLSGNVRVALSEMRAGAVAPVDGSISARFAGGRDKPIGLEEGALVLGAQTAPLAGAITTGADAFRLQAAGVVRGCEVSLVVDTKEPAKSGGGFSTKCKPTK